MVLLAKRVSAKREPVKIASTSSADEKRRMRSKMSADCSRLSNFLTFSVSRCLCGELASLVRRADANIPKPRRASAMPRAHDLLRLPLAAIRSSPYRPLIARANRIHRIPKLRGDPGIRRILQHPDPLAALDLPRDFASELKVVALVVNRPRLVGLHVDAIVSRGNELFQTQRLFSGQNADVGHPNQGQPVPPFGAQRSARSRRADGVGGFARTEISSEASLRDNGRRLRGHTFVVIGESSQARSVFLPRIGHDVHQFAAVAQLSQFLESKK